MKGLKLLSIFASFFALYSCSADITTSIQKHYPQNTPDNVAVFNPGEAIPDSAEIIGSVKITAYEKFTRREYDKMIQRGRVESAKVGGNGFAVGDYTTTSNNTRMNANILYIQGFGNDSISSRALTNAELAEQNMLLEYQARKIVPANSFLVGIGYGWIVSDLILGDNGTKLNPFGGLEIRAEYNHTFKGGIGIGAVYSGFFRESQTGPYLIKINLNYFGPTVTYSFRYDKLIGRIGCGLGAAIFSDVVQSRTCFGFTADMRLEYMLTDHVGLNVMTSAITCTYGRTNNGHDFDGLNGIKRFNLTGGLCFYF